MIEELLRRYPTTWLSVSATTRPPRVGETDGVQYHFLDEERFRERARRKEFLEWAEVHGNLYGTPRDPLVEKRAQGHDVVLEIDVQGARQVRAEVPDAVTIFVLPPSLEALEERLRGRGTEGEEERRRRLLKALEESREKDDYDYVIVNDRLDRAVEELCAIYEKESPLRGAGKEKNGRFGTRVDEDQDR